MSTIIFAPDTPTEDFVSGPAGLLVVTEQLGTPSSYVIPASGQGILVESPPVPSAPGPPGQQTGIIVFSPNDPVGTFVSGPAGFLRITEPGGLTSAVLPTSGMNSFIRFSRQCRRPG